MKCKVYSMKQLHRSFTLYFWYRHLFGAVCHEKFFFSVSLFVFTTKANFGKQTWKPIYCELLETLGKVAKHISCDMRESFRVMFGQLLHTFKYESKEKKWNVHFFSSCYPSKDAFLCIYETNVSFFRCTMCKMEQNISLVTEKNVL